jgi:hypothetical protein
MEVLSERYAYVNLIGPHHTAVYDTQWSISDGQLPQRCVAKFHTFHRIGLSSRRTDIGRGFAA